MTTMRQAELIEHQASRWLAARDANAQSDDDAAEFTRWIQADIRNRVAYLRLEASFQRCDRLNEIKPLDRGVDPDLLRARRPRDRWVLALAAGVVVALMIAGVLLVQSQLGWQSYDTPVGGFSRIVLEDGSVIDLNTHSQIHVRLRPERRDIHLERGEGRFQVAHDPRPFMVTVGEASMHAVGTTFSVRVHAAERVEVLVAEGAVAIDSGRQPHAPPVNAGEAVVLLPDRMTVSPVDSHLFERRMAWTQGQLSFNGDSLGQAVGEFNRYNRRQLKLSDTSLARLRVSGAFNATDPDSFAAALSATLGLRIDPTDTDAIVLRPP